MSVEFGIFGGSFDPPHMGHTLLAAYALSAHALQRVIVVPTYAHAFAKPLSAFEDRVRMCELAFADLRRVEVSSVERQLPVPSVTVRTLEALVQQHPGVQLRLLIGSDLSAQISSWHESVRVVQLAPPLVVQRSGHTEANSSLPALPDVSSTEIRQRLRAGQTTLGLLSPGVADYARDRGLYGP